MWKHTKRQNEFCFPTCVFIVMSLTAVCVLFLIKLRWPRKRSIYLEERYQYFIEIKIVSLLHYFEIKKINKKNPANLVPALWVACTLPLWISVVSLVVIWYYNFEILVCFIWSLHSSRGQLNTLKSWPFAPRWGGQHKGKWEFLPMPSGSQS